MKVKTGLLYLATFAACMPPQLLTAQTWMSVGPVARAYHSAVLDPLTNKMILFGGLPSGAITNGTQNLNDVWRLNLPNLAWTQVNVSGTAPARRIGHSAVYDAASNRMIVFGGGEGRTSPCENDVWVLTNANGSGGTSAWIRLNPTGSAPAARIQHGAVYDPNTNSMIVYGGQNCFSTVFQDVWVLSNANGVSGTPTWTQLNPSSGGPGQREIWHSVGYDSTNNRLVIFGCGNGTTNDVWVLSNANGEGGTANWSQILPSGTLPPSRCSDTLTYDSATNTMTLFGGSDASGNLFSDAWVLSNANGLGGTSTWTQLATGSVYFPEGRNSHTAVYNSSTNQMIVFGGQINPFFASPAIDTNDVFMLSHANGR